MKVTVFGIGYVGLVQAAVLAAVGHDVVCVDVDSAKVEALKKGSIPIYEPGLTPLVQEVHIAAGHIWCALVDHYLFENVQAIQSELSPA